MRVQSAYSAAFDTPILSNPDLHFEVSGYANNAHKEWASHDQKLKGGTARLKWLFPQSGHKHEFSYEGIWRQITSLASEASPTVRADAGDSFKSSLSHSWIWDRRDNPLLPTRGFLMNSVAALAGFGALRGDVAFSKLELETQAALPVPVPFTSSDPGISLTMGLRGGAMCPLTLGSTGELTHSRINDRFQLGGPTDVRGFRLGGLGPRDGADAIGGDVYVAGGTSLLLPFPKVGKEAPLRLQAFVNGGRLVGLGDATGSDEKNKSSTMTSSDVGKSLLSSILQLGDGLPSMSAGVGVVYAIPAARFEVNFSLPLVVRRGEEARKGLSVGLGMSFL